VSEFQRFPGSKSHWPDFLVLAVFHSLHKGSRATQQLSQFFLREMESLAELFEGVCEFESFSQIT
jgi:hypothetical protein